MFTKGINSYINIYRNDLRVSWAVYELIYEFTVSHITKKKTFHISIEEQQNVATGKEFQH